MNRNATQPVTYTALAKGLHWLIAGLIVSQYVLAKLAERAGEKDAIVQQLALLANHKSVGITILALALVRLGWRMFNPQPALPASMPKWQHIASSAAHWLLYGFLFALPITGWLMSSAKAYSVSWFNLVALPDFVRADESLAESLKSTHDLLAEALFVLAVIHVLAALKHRFVDKDDVLQRMFGWKGFALFVGSIVIVVALFGRFEAQQQSATKAVETIEETQTDSITVISELPVWDIDYVNSWIKFRGDQAGAPFEGQWQSWRADIQFDAEQLSDSRFDVVIDVASVASGDAERDGYIVGEDFFHQSQFAEARFQTRDVELNDEGFVAQALLTMKGATLPVAFTFSVEETGEQRVLRGKSRLDRLAWNIGAGDWMDTSWVGQFVDVEVLVLSNGVKPKE